MSGQSVAALGGGHGLAATLRAVRLLTDDVTAIVTVADNGGSSGRLREEFGVLPPGDLRMALAALCDDSEWGHIWRDALQHRFAGEGTLGGHALGNLLILALWQINEDPVAGLDLVGRLLNARGRVLPMAAVPLDILAEVTGADAAHPDHVDTVRGQVEVATTPGTVQRVRLEPQDPPAYPEAVAAIRSADWVVLGPGSWFTSVMPHLLVPDLADALVATRGGVALVLNLVDDEETSGFSAAAQLRSLREYAPRVRIDTVVADPRAVGGDPGLDKAAAELGARVLLAPMARRGHRYEHDPLRLAAALQDAFAGRT